MMTMRNPNRHKGSSFLTHGADDHDHKAANRARREHDKELINEEDDDMPGIQQCSDASGNPGFKIIGGLCHIYDAGNVQSRVTARQKAEADLEAVRAQEAAARRQDFPRNEK